MLSVCLNCCVQTLHKVGHQHQSQTHRVHTRFGRSWTAAQLFARKKDVGTQLAAQRWFDYTQPTLSVTRLRFLIVFVSTSCDVAPVT